MAYLLGRGLGKEESPPVDTVIFVLCNEAISGQGWKIRCNNKERDSFSQVKKPALC
ncbi:hypothetical protein M441DRAFT_63580 [Trichoderma asperellum CBS 433.97]|uniref:Uncharacterized protein n=1 Tax=Trichoderma asperellum (strain ATCC 204424 / CBS 433.97 / NBRC 101777) TaxID=1042311 RepID=A0A2T3ZNA9_TRIA4|nr:hypothetical protein M441DRAFT_63580 [Trichoderma asperellum CBS 433.97]PTB46295.1 hypothetical protein M441DRAFT_63580 [Trichoderma asperellum CBS 433.97]